MEKSQEGTGAERQDSGGKHTLKGDGRRKEEERDGRRKEAAESLLTTLGEKRSLALPWRSCLYIGLSQEA